MNKWDYLQLSWFTEKGRLRYAVNGDFETDWDHQAMHVVLNNLGGQGWEMVALDYGEQQAFFKRPSAG